MTRMMLVLVLLITPLWQVHPCCCQGSRADDPHCQVAPCPNCPGPHAISDDGAPLDGPCPCREVVVLAAVFVEGSSAAGDATVHSIHDSANGRFVGDSGDPTLNATSRRVLDASTGMLPPDLHTLLQRFLL